ncbi:MAG: serine hydrolase domain-containing protein, partial [Xanthobacteraceae bacterium]
EGQADWNVVLHRELLGPLGMKDSSYSAEAIEAAANHADGHRWTPAATIEVPFTPFFPYGFGGAGDINSTVEDAARWVRLQLGNGNFEGRRIVSPENLTATRIARVAIGDKAFYAMGWLVSLTPSGNVLWHNGGTYGFGGYIGMLADRDVGLIILTNAENVGFPDALGAWAFDRLLNNPAVDHVANTLKAATAKFEATDKLFAKPANPRPFPPLASLAGNFVDASFGKAALRVDGDAHWCWSCKLPAASSSSNPGMATCSRCASARADRSSPWPRIWARGQSASPSCRSTRKASSVCSACRSKMDKPTNSAASRRPSRDQDAWHITGGPVRLTEINLAQQPGGRLF